LKTLAKIISILFHPLLLPSYAFAMIYFTNPLLFSAYDPKQLIQIFLTVIINTLIFPVIAILLVWQLKFVKSLSMPDAKDRLVPYLTTGVFYIWGYVVFRKSGMPQILDIIILGAAITLFAVFMFNLFRKVSAHAGAMGAFFMVTVFASVLTAYNFNYLPIAVVLLAGIVGSCRLLLGAHDSYEVFAGYLIGMISQVVAMRFY
jgi:membrane-associated phospholipid phosphatase